MPEIVVVAITLAQCPNIEYKYDEAIGNTPSLPPTILPLTSTPKWDISKFNSPLLYSQWISQFCGCRTTNATPDFFALLSLSGGIGKEYDKRYAHVREDMSIEVDGKFQWHNKVKFHRPSRTAGTLKMHFGSGGVYICSLSRSAARILTSIGESDLSTLQPKYNRWAKVLCVCALRSMTNQ